MSSRRGASFGGLPAWVWLLWFSAVLFVVLLFMIPILHRELVKVRSPSDCAQVGLQIRHCRHCLRVGQVIDHLPSNCLHHVQQKAAGWPGQTGDLAKYPEDAL